MDKILHHQGFIHPRWLFGISSINSISVRKIAIETAATLTELSPESAAIFLRLSLIGSNGAMAATEVVVVAARHQKTPGTMWVFPKIGEKTLKWMVKIMEKPY